MPPCCSSAFDIGASEAQRINRIAHGHPLALTLAGAGIFEQPQRELEEAATGPVIDTLARLYLEDVDDPLARRALEASSVVRRTTEPLLDAMLDGDDPGDALERLLQLPFVEAGRDGLVVHDAVRERDRRVFARREPGPAIATIAERHGASCETRCATRRRASSGATRPTCST